MSKKEKRQNLKVIQHDLVKKVFVRYPGLSLGHGRERISIARVLIERKDFYLVTTY